MQVRSIRNQRRILGVIFLLPSLLMLCVFLFYPVVNSIIMSLTNWSGFTSDYEFVGLKNYVRVFTKMPEYWSAMLVNLKFAVISTLLQTIMGFFLAYFLYCLPRRAQGFFKVAIYLPVILPSAVVAVMWTFIYTPDFGLLNQLLRAIGLPNLALGWLGDYKTALASIIVTNTWRYVGFTTVLYYIAMLDVSTEVIEAAMMDGATHRARLFSIFLPITRGTTELNVLLSLIGGMKAFDLFYLMTGGGPGTSTQVVGMLIYRTAFQAFKFSRALTMSILLFIIILVLTIISRRAMRDKEEG